MGQGWANAAGRQARTSAQKNPWEKKRRTHMEKVAQSKQGTASPNGCNEAAWVRRWPVPLGTTMDHREFFASPFTNGSTIKLLHINASKRRGNNESLKMASTFIAELRNHTQLELDTFNLFDDKLPEFAGLAVGAKMALFSGSGFSSAQTKVWEEMKQIFDRFARADAYIFNT